MNDVSNDEYNSDFYLGGALIKDVLGVELTGSLQHTDESGYSGGGDSAASRPDSDTTQLGVKFNWAVNAKNRMSIAYNTSNIDFKHTPVFLNIDDGTCFLVSLLFSFTINIKLFLITLLSRC